MCATQVGEKLLDDNYGRKLGVAMDGRGVTGGAGDYRDGVGDTFGLRDGGMSEV